MALLNNQRVYQKMWPGASKKKKTARFEKNKSFFGDKTFLMTDQSWWKPIPRGVRPGWPRGLPFGDMNLVSCTVARAQPNSAELCSNCRMMTCQTPHGTAVLEKPLENPIDPLSFWWKLVQSSTTRWAMPLTLWSPLDSLHSNPPSEISSHLGMIFGGLIRSSNGFSERTYGNQKRFRIVSWPNFPYLPMITPIFSDTIWLFNSSPWKITMLLIGQPLISMGHFPCHFPWPSDKHTGGVWESIILFRFRFRLVGLGHITAPDHRWLLDEAFF